MKKILNNIFISLLFILVSTCHNTNPINSPEEQPPNSRDYTWNVDTLDVQYLGELWGDSPNDIWAVEQFGYFVKQPWHYDGKKWTEYTKETVDCSCSTIFGFSANNIWIGGETIWTNYGAIWHYDGTSWKENFIYDVKGAYIYSIWGNSPNDIYACGTIWNNGKVFGFILHYDGVTWKENIRNKYNSQYLKIIGKKSNDKIYVFDYKFNDYSSSHDTITYDELSGTELNEIYSNTVNNINWSTFTNIDDELYFLIGQDFYIYENGDFVKQLYLANHEDPFQWHFFGRSAKDIFICMSYGLAQYNGEDIKYVYKFSQGGSSYEREDVIFDKELFCVFKDYDNNKTMILHGKQK